MREIVVNTLLYVFPYNSIHRNGHATKLDNNLRNESEDTLYLHYDIILSFDNPFSVQVWIVDNSGTRLVSKPKW